MDMAVITGASAGIGKATAQLFADRGYRVCNLARRPSGIDSVDDIRCDLSSEASLQEAMDALLPLLREAERITLIHNASRTRKDRADHCDSDDLRDMLQINLVAANSLNQVILPLMKAGSSVIYVGSTLAEKAVADSFSYVVSKHALVGMMRATCQDLMGRGIHTACVCPGFTDTAMLRAHVGNDQAVLDELAAGNSFGRLVEAEEIAALLYSVHRQPALNGTVVHAHLGQRET